MYHKLMAMSFTEVFLECERVEAEVHLAMEALHAETEADNAHDSPLRIYSILKKGLDEAAALAASYPPQVQRVMDLFVNGAFPEVVLSVDALKVTDVYQNNRETLDRLRANALMLGKLIAGGRS